MMPPQCKTIRLHRTELSCHCCFPSWSVIHIKQIGEQWRGMHRMESALINLQISSMWCSSCHRPYSLHFSQYDYSEKRRKTKELVVMLPGTYFIQIVLSPARHNSIFTVLACLWIQFSLEHFFSALCCVLANFGILLRYCLHVFSVFCQYMSWRRCCPCPSSAKHIKYPFSVQKLRLCVSSPFYTF